MYLPYSNDQIRKIEADPKNKFAENEKEDEGDILLTMESLTDENSPKDIPDLEDEEDKQEETKYE